ncbi:helix-turn-helix domain-containing protein [Hungatella effluvii]|uniref:helix-turn-helix domain-containing protein n=1 Tax=Hungatella effluvii TaxID=1096246 RepID=UPI002A818E93|nr:helix-turn-helix transcriptional regulator [Hungatella effluvii]
MDNLDVSYMGAVFRAARKAKGMTQEQVAEIIDITPRYLIALEKGEKTPSLEKMLLLAHHLNIPGDVLVHPQLETVDEEDQKILRLFMQLNARDKKVILAAIQEMLSQT